METEYSQLIDTLGSAINATVHQSLFGPLPAAGNGQQITGNGQRATGNWQLATGNWQLATGNG